RETVARCREERADVATLRPSHRRDLLRVHPSLRDEIVHAGDDIPRIADAEVTVVEHPELLAIPGTSAVVDLEDQCAARRPDVNGIVLSIGKRRTIDSGGPAMDHA